MIRVVARDRTGIVILRDERDDGSYVLLECEEFEPSGGGGILGDPADDEEVFPLLAENIDIHAKRTGRQPFRLDVDISDMPRGELRFRNREFIEQAVEQAERERVAITPETADAWGYIGRGTS